MMGRYYGLSPSRVTRMVSAIQAARKRKENDELISSQKGIKKDFSPKYSLIRVDFNYVSRVTKIEFEETKRYRKIERYVTQNYTRHPIYSEILTKSKKIVKTLKLTNKALEELNSSEDQIISGFAYEIISKINIEDLFPSWFIIQTLKNDLNEEIDEEDKNHQRLVREETEFIKSVNKKILELNKEKSMHNSFLSENVFRKNKVDKKIKKAKNVRYKVLLSIVTLGIYAYFHSNIRIKRLQKKTDLIDLNIKRNETNVKKLNDQINDYSIETHEHEKTIIENNERHQKKIKNLNAIYSKKIEQVVPLLVEIDESNYKDFVPLKKLVGVNYKKIIGCYVIRNKENGKCYVGQSKDVLKRICKQHFDGTKIKNVVFAEDYYMSKVENRDDLFEVKIVELQTKDELDKTEAQLIEEYDSFNNGYNATSGNS